MDSQGSLYYVALNHSVHHLNWNSSAKEVMTMFCANEGIMAIELSKIAQNELLMTLANGEIKLFNLNTLQTLHSFNGLLFGKYIKRAIFGGPNECFILVGTGESTIFIGD